MPLQKWKKLKEQVLYENPWWTYKLDSFKLINGHQGEYHYVHTEGSSMVIPVLGNGKILLVKQYRYLCERESLEFPCGGVKQGDTYEQTALKELAEEAGYTAADLALLGEFNPYNGITNEMCRVYAAKGLQPVESARDATEEFETVVLSPAELESRISRGEIWDGMTLASWNLARNRI